MISQSSTHPTDQVAVLAGADLRGGRQIPSGAMASVRPATRRAYRLPTRPPAMLAPLGYPFQASIMVQCMPVLHAETWSRRSRECPLA